MVLGSRLANTVLVFSMVLRSRLANTIAFSMVLGSRLANTVAFSDEVLVVVRYPCSRFRPEIAMMLILCTSIQSAMQCKVAMPLEQA